MIVEKDVDVRCETARKEKWGIREEVRSSTQGNWVFEAGIRHAHWLWQAETRSAIQEGASVAAKRQNGKTNRRIEARLHKWLARRVSNSPGWGSDTALSLFLPRGHRALRPGIFLLHFVLGHSSENVLRRHPQHATPHRARRS